METIKEFCEIMDEIMLDLRFLRGLDNEKVCKFRKILKEIIHCCNLHAPLCVLFAPNLIDVARYNS